MADVEYKSYSNDRTIPFIETIPEESPSASVLMIHGIFQHKNEDGRFTRMAQRLDSEGFHTVRFDYAGHGEHSIDAEEMTISTALVDIHRMMEYMDAKEKSNRLFVVATSFGASLFLLYLRLRKGKRPERIVLLNPVTDYETTFLHPVKEDMKEIFTDERLEQVYKTGSAEFLPEKDFTFALPFIIELELYKPYLTFPELDIPTKVIHGDSDKAVPYDVTKNHACQSPAVDFHTIEGADHAFMQPESEAESFDVTTAFLKEGL